MSSHPRKTTILGLLVLFGLAFGSGWAGGACSTSHGQARATPASTSSSAAPLAPAPEAREVGDAFVAVAARLAPAVVRITMERGGHLVRIQRGEQSSFLVIENPEESD